MRMMEIGERLAARGFNCTRRTIQLWAQRGLISAPSGKTSAAVWPEHVMLEIFAAAHMMSRGFHWLDVNTARRALLKSALAGSDPSVIFETRPWKSMEKLLAHWLLGWGKESLSLPVLENVSLECWTENGRIVFQPYTGPPPYPANVHPYPREFLVFRKSGQDQVEG